MADTKITRLRNLMTPIANYFAMMKDLDKTNQKGCSDKKLFKLLEIVTSEEKKCNENLPEILKIIKQIPDNACEGNPTNSKPANCAIFDVSVNEEAVTGCPYRVQDSCNFRGHFCTDETCNIRAKPVTER